MVFSMLLSKHGPELSRRLNLSPAAISLIGGVGAALIAMTLQPPDRSLMGEHREFDQKPVPA
jgi:hypothetical protein